MGPENYLVGVNIGFNRKIIYDAPIDRVPNINEDKSEELILVLDPSSSQTGIVLGTDSGELRMFADFKNKACSLNEYKSYLNDYLGRLSKVYNITKFVYEIPFSKNGDRISEVLSNLEDNFKKYERVINGLEKENMFPMLPGVWRKSFLKDKRYDGRRIKRENLKEAAREECGIRLPEYKDYFYSTDYVPDSTDAIGIYNGFLNEYWYDQSRGIKRVSKVNSRYSKNQIYEVYVASDTPEVIYRMAKETIKGRLISTYEYNNKYDLSTNCEIVTAQTDNVCVLLALDNLSRNLLKWEADREIVNSDMLAVIVYRKRRIKK